MSYNFNAKSTRALVRALVWFIRSHYYGQVDTLIDSDKDVALYCGITPAQFSRIASCACTPSAVTLLKLMDLAVAKGYDLNVIFSNE